jgi:uncharacterized protein (DUF779 family)
MLFQSGGCCDGSSPLCLHEGELAVGPNDLLLGRVDGVPFYIDAEQYERWKRPRFQLDLLPGCVDSFSLETADRVHFVTLGRGGLPKDSDPAAALEDQVEADRDEHHQRER